MADADETAREGTAVAPPNKPGDRFAQLIRSARKKAGLTQDDLANHTGISRSSIIRWEHSHSNRPDPQGVRVVCSFLGIDPREAAIALGYLSRNEAYSSAPKILDPLAEEVIEILADPNIPDTEKEHWIDYLRFLANKHRPTKAAAMRATNTYGAAEAAKSVESDPR
ncbi:helix-turn-helix domain-containing protein [Solwaraspora sp. WMMB335]|uniref:helix-turn-helix domain-containing protein n=1 Tax=Solwaraspora sp. WMMB335 TaxID=3404118 RepID=UPI003B9267C5